jgi:SAM-dependent methyltransferase
LLDVGCGTGVALNYLAAFHAYHGFDPDERAIKCAARARPASNVHLHNRLLDERELALVRPTKALLIGLLHHLDTRCALGLLRMLAAAPTLSQVVTLDVIYIQGRYLNNLLARLDRGKFVRTVPGMRALFQESPFYVKQFRISTSGNGFATYLIADLQPRADTHASIAA